MFNSLISIRPARQSLIPFIAAKPSFRCYDGFNPSGSPKFSQDSYNDSKPLFSSLGAPSGLKNLNSNASATYASGFQNSYSHRGGQTGSNSMSMNNGNGNESAPYGSGFRNSFSRRDGQTLLNSISMNFVRNTVEQDGRDIMRGIQIPRYNVEHNADIVHIKLMRNNTFITVTDSKGNKKIGASAGSVPEMKGGAKVSRYAAEATAEYVGRLSRNLGLKSVVMKVKGFTYFKKKRQAIMSWREGFTSSRVNQNPVVYIEDTTRRAHNGCRLPKRRRV